METETDWEPGRWWRILDPTGHIWAETSDENEARSLLRPGDRLYREYERRGFEWREEV